MRRSPARPQEIVTFKADPSLLEALRSVTNRSAFIRNAVLAALENICPLCRGRGILTPNQKNHWAAFAADHGLATCDDCHELHLVCGTRPRRLKVHAHPAARLPRARRASSGGGR
jgi:hypothetical protein